MILRRELPGDRDTIFHIHSAAFSRPEGKELAEARLVDALREDGDVIPGLSVVAVIDDGVVGHVLCSRATVGGRPALGLGPLGVLPAHQRRAVGIALMHAVLAAADALHEPAVVLLGNPGYYRRFGFVPAGSLGLDAPDPTWREHFQVRMLTAWDGSLHGPVRYAPAFDSVYRWRRRRT